MDTESTVGERIVLLALDEESGVLREPPLRVGLAVAAARLVELARSGHLTVAGGRLVAAARPPAEQPGDPVAAALAGQVRTHPDGPVHGWLLAVREQALSAAYEGLLTKGLVRREDRRVLKAFGTVRYPVTDPAVPAALRAELAEVVRGDREPGEGTATLIAVMYHARLHTVAFSGAEAGELEARVPALTRESEPATALGEAVRQAFAAAAVVAATAGG
ncbi:GPP34 family phosphoprotein [Streptomyces sp. NPDC050674]|uniref:GOLPH3/VPS74 family protein n=1 Tax=Streptomyces sp. NPDC050674 TaxID=3157216 RepID=UPI003432A256